MAGSLYHESVELKMDEPIFDGLFLLIQTA